MYNSYGRWLQRTGDTSGSIRYIANQTLLPDQHHLCQQRRTASSNSTATTAVIKINTEVVPHTILVFTAHNHLLLSKCTNMLHDIESKKQHLLQPIHRWANVSDCSSCDASFPNPVWKMLECDAVATPKQTLKTIQWQCYSSETQNQMKQTVNKKNYNFLKAMTELILFSESQDNKEALSISIGSIIKMTYSLPGKRPAVICWCLYFVAITSSSLWSLKTSLSREVFGHGHLLLSVIYANSTTALIK